VPPYLGWRAAGEDETVGEVLTAVEAEGAAPVDLVATGVRAGVVAEGVVEGAMDVGVGVVVLVPQPAIMNAAIRRIATRRKAFFIIYSYMITYLILTYTP
jgi:hypothetical protein